MCHGCAITDIFLTIFCIFRRCPKFPEIAALRRRSTSSRNHFLEFQKFQRKHLDIIFCFWLGLNCWIACLKRLDKCWGIIVNGSKNCLVFTGATWTITWTVDSTVGNSGGFSAGSKKRDEPQQQPQFRTKTTGVYTSGLHQQVRPEARIDQQAE